ncbi:MAG: hypothetical protein ACMZ64_08390 [Oleiphilus sp.]
MKALEITVRPYQVRRFLLTTISVLAVMHIAQLCIYFYIDDPDTFDFIQLLDFDYEGNLPSFYSALALLYCAQQLFWIAKFHSRERDAFIVHWYGLSGIFAFLAVDEASALHEEVGDLVESLALFDAEGFLYFAWVVPYGLLLIVFLLSYLKFLLHLPKNTRQSFLMTGSLFIAGAVGIETLSAQEADVNGTLTIWYSTLYTLEELFEMVAIALFAHSLLIYQASKHITLERNVRSHS